jgi:hypothetical protein
MGSVAMMSYRHAAIIHNPTGQEDVDSFMDEMFGRLTCHETADGLEEKR